MGKPPMIGPYSPYLEEAQAAVSYVKRKLTDGAANEPIAWLRPWHAIPSFVKQLGYGERMQKGLDEIRSKPISVDDKWLLVVELWAEIALEMGLGIVHSKQP